MRGFILYIVDVYMSPWLNVSAAMLLRMAANEILNAQPGSTVVIALCCNSYTAMLLDLKSCCVCVSQSKHVKRAWYRRSKGTSDRNILNLFLGNSGYTYVAIGNLLASRVASWLGTMSLFIQSR